MPDIIIHLTKEQLQELCEKQVLVIGLGGQSPSTFPTVGHEPQATRFLDFFKDQIRKLQIGGNPRTLETYRGAYKKFRRFMQDEDVPLQRITSDLMEAYQVYLKAAGLSLNSISFHMRILRAVYHRAVEQGLADDKRPFRHVYTGMAKTAKRALSLQEIKRIRNVATDSPELQFARDIFMFSFYTRGMSFVDIAHLRKSDIRDGVLTYKRQKTGQTLCICWEPCMQEIVDRYPSGNDTYLLPLIRRLNGKERNQYRHLQTKVNANLKAIGAKARISQKLTMYCARHSWATIAREMNVPVGIISRGLGHTNEQTTEIYLKSIDARKIDAITRKILKAVKE